MGVKTCEELLWLALMLRWENAGAPDGVSCTLDGEPAINSQIERMAYHPEEARRRCRRGAVPNPRPSIPAARTVALTSPRIRLGWRILRILAMTGFSRAAPAFRRSARSWVRCRRLDIRLLSLKCCGRVRRRPAPGKSVRRFLTTKEEAERMLAEPGPPGMERFEVPPDLMQQISAAFAD